jgi:hypothetical protein
VDSTLDPGGRKRLDCVGMDSGHWELPRSFLSL